MRKSILLALIVTLAGVGYADPVAGDSPQRAVLAPMTEQQIYVPYENLSEVLEKEEKGVLIPHSDFLKLWEKATQKAPEDISPTPPVDAAIVYAEYQGTVTEDIAEFQATLKISALKKEWARIFLNVEGIAITSLAIKEQTPLLSPVEGGLELILPEKGDYELHMSFSARVNTAPGEKFIHFKLPASPLTKISMVIPGKDLDVKVEPMLSQQSAVKGDNTEFSAFLAPEGDVDIRWLAKSLESKEVKSLVFGSLSTEVFIKESVYLLTTRVSCSVMQAKTDAFQLKIPGELSLVNVSGDNIKDWDMGADGVLSVNLYEEVDGNYTFTVNTEKYRDMEDTSFTVPEFELVDAKREDGEVIIKADSSLRVQVDEKEHVTQIDPKELAGRVAFEDFVSAFKYFRRPYRVSLSISVIQPKITAQQNIYIAFSETLIDYFSQVSFQVKDAGVFKFRFLIPGDFRLVEVGDDETVDNFTVTEENGQNILTVTLKNKAYGNFLLPIHLEADKEDKGVTLPMPKVQSLDAEKEEGVIALSLRKNLKLSTDDIKALRPVSLEELKSLGGNDPDQKNEVAAGYRFSTPDYSCRLKIEKRNTKIIANVERSVSVEETVMKTSDVVHYNVLYAPVSQFRIELPEAVARDAVISGANIKEKRLSADPETKTGVWEVTLHSPVLNQYDLTVMLERKLPSIPTGEKRTIAVPGIRVLDVFDESGFISVAKSPNLQVESKESNLEPIDSKELPAALNRGQSVLAFRYLSHPYSLTLETTKHEYEKILDAIVNQAHFDIVISNEGLAKTEGIFNIQNTNRQSLELTMPLGTDKIYSVFISGKKASISRGSSERNKIVMLPKDIAPGQEFSLRILYQTKVSADFGFAGGFRVENAEIGDVPTSKITWRLYLPQEFSYLYMGGSMNPQTRDGFAYNDINASIPSQRVSSPVKINLNSGQIPQQKDESEFYGLDINMVRQGRMFSFAKLDKGADLRVWYIKKSVLFPLSLIFIVLPGLLFFTVVRKKAGNPLRVVAVFLLTVIILNILLPQGFKYFVFLLFTGSLLASGGYVFYRFLQKRDAFRKTVSRLQKKKNGPNK